MADEDKTNQDELDKEESAQDQSTTDSTTEDQSTEQADTEETETEDGSEGEETESQEDEDTQTQKPSRRETLRIQQLIQRYKQQQNQPLKPKTPQEAQDALDYRQTLDADDEVIERLESDRQTYGDTQRNQGQQEALKQVQTVQWNTMLHLDAPQVEQRYKFLDSRDEQNFHPGVAGAVNDWYLQMSGYEPGDPQKGRPAIANNPNIRYADFVDGLMELAEEIASIKVQDSTKNITKQASQTGLRPDGSQSKRINLNKPPEQMTDEELNAVISQAIPKK